MTDFLKTFGKGVLYVVLLPFIVLFVALFMVYLFITYFVMAIKSVIIFFAGGDPLGDLPEDIEAKKILEGKEKAFNEGANQQTQTTNTTTNNNSTVINQSIYVNPNDLAAFFAQQAANQQNQQLHNNGNPTPIDAQPDPLFVETTKEGGTNNDEQSTDVTTYR